MNTFITATTNASTSTNVDFSGVVKIKADDLGPGEYVKVLEERVDGDYGDLVDDGWRVLLTQERPSVLLELLGNHKVEKTETVADVAVGYVAQ